MKKVLSILLAVVVIVGGGGYLLATRADAATPVDPLFSIDTFFEDVQRLVTLDEVAKVELEQSILEERQLEVEAVLALEDEVAETDVEECLDLMTQQMERAGNILGEAIANQEQKGDTDGVQALEQVQNQYQEQLQKQYETATKAHEKYGVGEDAKGQVEEEQNSLQNQGEDTQNQQQNDESNTDNSEDSGNGNSDSGNSSSSSSGNSSTKGNN